MPPESTWRRIEPLLEGFGITRIADITGFDEVGIPVFHAIRPEAYTLAVSQGNGLTRELARLSAAMEAIERWHAERAPPVSIRCSAGELGPLGYALEELEHEPRSVLSHDLVLDWIEGTSKPSQRPALVPRDCVRLSELVHQDWAPPTLATGSRGLASGNSIAEATVHALCELVEGDCLAHRLGVPDDQREHVDLTTVHDRDCAALIDRFQATCNRVDVLDLTGDLGVPCFVASITSASLPIPLEGAGCHLDPTVAFAQALTEAAEQRVTFIAGARDDLPLTVEAARRHMALIDPVPGPPPRTVAFRSRSLATESVEGDLAFLATRIRDRTGVEPIVVDLSDPERGVPVVKVVAPALRTGRSPRVPRRKP